MKISNELPTKSTVVLGHGSMIRLLLKFGSSLEVMGSRICKAKPENRFVRVLSCTLDAFSARDMLRAEMRAALTSDGSRSPDDRQHFCQCRSVGKEILGELRTRIFRPMGINSSFDGLSGHYVGKPWNPQPGASESSKI